MASISCHFLAQSLSYLAAVVLALFGHIHLRSALIASRSRSDSTGWIRPVESIGCWRLLIMMVKSAAEDLRLVI